MKSSRTINTYLVTLEDPTHLRQILAMIPREVIQYLHFVSLQFGSEIGGATGLVFPREAFNITISLWGRFIFMERTIDAFCYFFMFVAKYAQKTKQEREYENLSCTCHSAEWVCKWNRRQWKLLKRFIMHIAWFQEVTIDPWNGPWTMDSGFRMFSGKKWKVLMYSLHEIR